MSYTIGKITFGPYVPPQAKQVKAPPMQKTRQCSQDEFKAFLKAYPRKLKRDVYFVCEPPSVTYNDFTLGMWPASVVAGHTFSDRETTTSQAGWYILEGEVK